MGSDASCCCDSNFFFLLILQHFLVCWSWRFLFLKPAWLSGFWAVCWSLNYVKLFWHYVYVSYSPNKKLRLSLQFAISWRNAISCFCFYLWPSKCLPCNLNVFTISRYHHHHCCSPEDSDKVAEELQRADTVVLTYACDRPETLENLSIFWLPHLRKLEVPIYLYYYFFLHLQGLDIQLQLLFFRSEERQKKREEIRTEGEDPI